MDWGIGWPQPHLCTGDWLRLYQTLTNLTSGDMGICPAVIRLVRRNNQTEKYQVRISPSRSRSPLREEGHIE